MANEEYKVKGYGERNPKYDGPYHPSADFDPRVKFANAGDPEAAAVVAEAEYANSVAHEFNKDPEVLTDPDPSDNKSNFTVS